MTSHLSLTNYNFSFITLEIQVFHLFGTTDVPATTTTKEPLNSLSFFFLHWWPSVEGLTIAAIFCRSCTARGKKIGGGGVQRVKLIIYKFLSSETCPADPQAVNLHISVVSETCLADPQAVIMNFYQHWNMSSICLADLPAVN